VLPSAGSEVRDGASRGVRLQRAIAVWAMTILLIIQGRSVDNFRFLNGSLRRWLRLSKARQDQCFVIAVCPQTRGSTADTQAYVQRKRLGIGYDLALERLLIRTSSALSG
jgi:hypothetical protein